MDGPAAKKPRMGVNGTVGPEDSRHTKAAVLFRAAGYAEAGTEAVREFSEIHRQSEKCRWLENGFLQQFVKVGEQACRVCIYFPTQELQPHISIAGEDSLITHGAVDLWTWSGDSASAAPVHQRLLKGSRIVVPPGSVHCLRADARQGLVFHGLVEEDTFQKRSTDFQAAAEHRMPSRFAGRTVLVTGANRGLGLGLAKAFTALGARVVACCRAPAKAEELLGLSPKPILIELDVASDTSVAALPEKLRDSGVCSLDYVINNAGIASPNHPYDPILQADPEVMKSVFNVNVIGTIMVTKACLPLLEMAESKCVVNLSSQLASIEHCYGGLQGHFGGICSYRISRAASNMAMRCFGGELREQGYVFIAMSPGHVDTDMGSSGGRKAPLTVEQSVAGMLSVIAHSSLEDNGKFLQYDGIELPW
ncbi:unnamed protein product [Polarella glacialis]|uniref:Uncharacterized protein n=1 Tax=Polarella glacialis TaxID=89957 RepID=A0A813FGH4_POLGL|nr:unnamed protein product [Polarella glacialis]